MYLKKNLTRPRARDGNALLLESPMTLTSLMFGVGFFSKDSGVVIVRQNGNSTYLAPKSFPQLVALAGRRTAVCL